LLEKVNSMYMFSNEMQMFITMMRGVLSIESQVPVSEVLKVTSGIITGVLQGMQS